MSASGKERGGPNADGELFKTIVDQAPDAIILTDRHGRIRLWNAGAERLFGHAAAEVIGESLNVIIPECLRSSVLSVVGVALLAISGWLGGHMLFVHGVAVGQSRGPNG